MKRCLAVLAVAICFASAWSAAREREFTMPALVPATKMSSRDVHSQEQVAFAADAYDSAEKASLFRAGLLAHAVLPVLVVFTNDGPEPVTLDNVRFQLVTRDRAKAEAYSMDDLRRALTAVRAPGSRAQDKLPVPVHGRGSVHGGLSTRDREELQRAMFAPGTVAAHSSAQGFLFFDTSGLDHPADGARLYATGVSDARGRQLMYFEVPLGPAPAEQMPADAQ